MNGYTFCVMDKKTYRMLNGIIERQVHPRNRSSYWLPLIRGSDMYSRVKTEMERSPTLRHNMRAL